MAIVINGSGTVTGLAVGGLPDGTVDSDTLASGIDKTSITDSGDATAMTIDSGERIGIGNTVAGTMNGVNSSILTIGTGSGHSGMTVYTGSTNEGTINFADDTSGSGAYKGMVRYDHNTNALTLHSNATEAIKMDSTGAVTMSKQPAFQLIRTTNVSNVTGNGTAYTVAFNNEEFDQNADCSTTTFTAPVTGKYQFSFAIIFVSLSSATDVFVDLSTSNGGYRWNPAGNNPTVTGNTSYPSISGSILADLDASDTAVLEVTVNGVGGDTVDIYGSPTSGTFFSGHLAC